MIVRVFASNMSSLYQVSNLQPSIIFVTTISVQVDNADFAILNTDYDVYIWDLEAGAHPSRLYNTVQEVSARNCASRHEFSPSPTARHTRPNMSRLRIVVFSY